MIDLSVHELGRIRWPVRTRFSCADALLHVVLPGGLKFIGLDAIDTAVEALNPALDASPIQRTKPA